MSLLLLVLACVRSAPSTDAGYEPPPAIEPGPVDTAPEDTALPPGTPDDRDGDGVDNEADCQPDDPLAFPGAAERCNGLDDDCDGAPLDDEVDADSDGVTDCAACDEAGWWLPTRTLVGAALEAELAALVEPQTCFDYSDATDFLFLTLDNHGGEVECVYTGLTVAVGGAKPDATVMNTEHSWPQSEGADELPAKCDLHHLYPTDADANNARGSLPFGEVLTVTDDVGGGSRVGTDASGSTVFEPRDVHKGNVARSMLYFATRYDHALSNAELALYRDWHALDPVDADELQRTWDIAAEQELPNPFVVCPDTVDRL